MILPEITNVKFFRQFFSPSGIIFEPGALGPPLFTYDLYISERFFFSTGSNSCVFIFFGEVVGVVFVVNEITFSIGFLFDNFWAGLGTNASSSSSSVCSRIR